MPMGYPHSPWHNLRVERVFSSNAKGGHRLERQVIWGELVLGGVF